LGAGGGEESEEEELLLEEEGGRTDGTRSVQDGIAEPLYALLGEVFDLRGLFRWLRRSLITFVQITYGRTITR
jgi:sorting nexin-25